MSRRLASVIGITAFLIGSAPWAMAQAIIGSPDDAAAVSEDIVESDMANQELTINSDEIGLQDETESVAPDISGIEAAKAADDEDGIVTLDFRDADIRNVLRILSYKSGMNIVPAPDVAGLITIQLSSVPWEQALQVILENYGYGYEKKGNVIMVTTIENLKKRREDAMLLSEQEPLVTESFILNFAKASSVVEAVDKLKTGRGKVQYDNRTNTVIVRDTTSNMALIKGVIKQLDATTPQVLIESKIIETTLSNSENLGIDWVAEASISGSSRPTIYPFTTNSDSKYLPDNIPATTSGFTYGTLDFASVSAVLELLKSRTDTNILSNPRIVTLDNQKASISVGSQYPLPTYTYNEEQARLQVSGWEYMDIGVIFDVTPQVNNAGFVTLKIQPKITDILDYVTVEGTSLPRLSNEAVSTEVMIKDGDTLVIAGLIKDRIVDIRKKLPLLGDIPVFGYLFQKSEKSVSKTDLIIFLTPHIITPEVPMSF